MNQDIESTLPKPFIFVLMPFAEAFDDIYKFGIKGAADEVGAYAERLDEQIFTEGMLDRIFNQISKADLVVADMTGRNENVFYEVGYAHALGKIVVLLTQNSDDIPFDLKHRQHTVYGGRIEKLREELIPVLQWGIEESRRRAAGGGGERFSLQLFDKVIPRSGSVDEPPVISGPLASPEFQLRMQLRNDSAEESESITHVYLFCEEDSPAAPVRFEDRPIRFLGSSFGSTNWQSPGSQGTEKVAVPLSDGGQPSGLH